ncbi:MAG: hypothetical protein P0111_00955 [Nitrospira sp.]|nr:hypothetical protein [Nitrospira sp.]
MSRYVFDKNVKDRELGRLRLIEAALADLAIRRARGRWIDPTFATWLGHNKRRIPLS